MVIITSFDNVHSFRIHIPFEKSVTTTTISTFYDTFTRVTQTFSEGTLQGEGLSKRHISSKKL